MKGKKDGMENWHCNYCGKALKGMDLEHLYHCDLALKAREKILAETKTIDDKEVPF